MQLFRVLGMSMFCDLQGRKEMSHIYVDSDRGDLGFSLFSDLFIFSFFFFDNCHWDRVITWIFFTLNKKRRSTITLLFLHYRL